MEKNLSNERPNWYGCLLAFFKEVWMKGWFEPHSSFLRLKSFWVPFLVIVGIFVALWWRTCVDNNLKFDRYNWSVKDMYEWFKYPLWVLALLIPVIGLFNANHKSEQARAAMEQTESQNNFANYYKHLEEFIKHCNSVEKGFNKGGLEIKDRRLHSNLFPCAKSGGLSISEKELNLFFSHIEELDGALQKFSQMKLDGVPAGFASGLAGQSALGLVTRNEAGRNFNFKELKSMNFSDSSELNHVLTEKYYMLKVQQEVMSFDEASLGEKVEAKMSSLEDSINNLIIGWDRVAFRVASASE